MIHTPKQTHTSASYLVWLHTMRNILLVLGMVLSTGLFHSSTYAHETGVSISVKNTDVVFSGDAELKYFRDYALPISHNSAGSENNDESEIQENEWDDEDNDPLTQSLRVAYIEIQKSIFSDFSTIFLNKSTCPLYILYLSWKIFPY